MMNSQRLSTLLMCLLAPGLAVADPVDESQVTTFAAGQPACAEEVNQTIQALVAAVNDNAARVAELEAQLADQSLGLEDTISGAMFRIYSVESGLGSDSTTTPAGPLPTVAQTTGRLAHWLYAESVDLVLNDDGTITGTTADFQEVEHSVQTYATHDEHSPNVPDIRRVDIEQPVNDPGTGPLTGTWSLSGQVLTLNVDDDDLTDVFSFHVSPDGGTLVGGGQEIDSAPGFPVLLASVAMGVRILSPPEIGVTLKKTGSEQEVVNGGNYQFIGFGWESVEIANHGDRSLVISGVSPFGHASFALPAPEFPVTVLPGETFSFGVMEMASPGDTRITIDSNDPDDSSFLIGFDGVN